MSNIVRFCAITILSLHLLSWPKDKSLLYNSLQDQLAIRVNEQLRKVVDIEHPTHIVPVFCDRNQANARSVLAWRRVLSQLDGSEADELIRLEFCRFLGVLEADSNVFLPDFMLGLKPTVVDRDQRHIVAFHYPFTGRNDKANMLTIVDDSERNIGVTELSRNSDGILLSVNGHEGDVLIPDNCSGQTTIENHRHLSNGQLAILFRNGSGHQLAVYERNQSLPCWCEVVAMTIRPQISSTGPRFRRQLIIESNVTLAILEIGSMELSLSTFGRETGEPLFHFAICHGESFKNTP